MAKNSIEIEAKNLYRASLNAVKYLDKISIKKLMLSRSFFLMIHKMILANDKENAGKYRATLHDLEIRDKTFEPSPAWKIEHDIIDLIDFINNKHKWGPKYRRYFLNMISKENKGGMNKLNKLFTYKIFIAWYLHHRFVIIHPFTDGNGRTARLLMCLILRFEGLSEVTYPILINYLINKSTNKTKYLNSLQ